ncbi:uncharacterized protein LOC143224229 [Tachypleus tridentatus]|uniref:uncharacterized protein LOC143224229 n=1 Tax=Tachypleus tridentatus TaxID=6853 RepID=UPI003FCFB60E
MLRVAVTLCIIAVLFTWPSSTAFYIKRSPEQKHICSRTTPCGWGVYSHDSRLVQQYMRSPCFCPSGTRCVRTNDALIIYSFVYHCRPYSRPAEHVWPEYE